MPSHRLLIRNALQPAGLFGAAGRVDVLIDGGRIAAVAPSGSAGLSVQPEPTHYIDASTLIVLPGLVNAHVHSNEAFERGLYPALPLERWLARSYPPFGSPLLPQRWHYLRAMLVACDAIRSGTVALQDDFLNPGCDDDALDQVMQAWSDSGLRVSVATTLADRPYLDGLPFARELCDPELAASIDTRGPLPIAAQTEFFERVHRRWNGAGGGRLSLMLGPRGPQRCSDALLREVARLSRSHDSSVHMHVLETRPQRAASLQQGGGGFIRRLADAGLLNPDLTINHAVWVSDEDIRMIADAGACVTHNPLSNQRLGSGTSPVRQMRAAGIPVALGSDGPATGDTACMSAVLRAASLLHRDPLNDSDSWLGPHDAWQMATLGGAASMRLNPDFARIQAGAPADLMLLKAGHRAFIPHHDTIAQFALSSGPDAIDTVIVAGHPLMQAGRIVAFDEEAILAEAAEAGERWRSEVLPTLAESGQRIDPLLRKVLERIRTFDLAGAP